MARPAIKWMTDNEINSFFNSMIEQRNDIKHLNSDIYLDAEFKIKDYRLYTPIYAEAVRIVLKIYHPDIYEDIKRESDEYIQQFSFISNNEKVDYITKQLDVYKRFFNSRYGLVDDKARISLINKIDINFKALIDECLEEGYIYELIGRYLGNYQLEHNLSEYWDVLPDMHAMKIYRGIKIEKKELYTNLMTEDKKEKLLNSKYKGFWIDLQSEAYVEVNGFAYFMDRLSKKGYIVNEWKGIIQFMKCVYSEKGTPLNAKRLEKELKVIKDEIESVKIAKAYGKYKEIRDFVDSL